MHTIDAAVSVPRRPVASREGAAAATLSARGLRAMKIAATAWFAVAIAGQLLFATYVVAFYGRAAARSDFAAWNRVLAHGYVAGDTAGNAVLASHLALAIVVLAAGAVQLVPAVRRRWPAVHRWVGRAYLVAVLVASVGGTWFVWARGTVGDASQHVGITLNAALIVACAALAYRAARMRRFDAHRRWALRLYLAANGVWFFRIGLMAWIVVNQGPAGFDPKSFAGPFLSFLAFAQYLVPLALLELYFLAQRGGPRARFAMAAGLGAATLATVGGIAAASAILWLPRF